MLRFALTTYIVRMASDSVHSPQEVIDTVDNIPSVDQCWLQCISVLRSFADGSLWMGEEVICSYLLQCRLLNLLLIDYNGAFSVKVMVFLRVLHC